MEKECIELKFTMALMYHLQHPCEDGFGASMRGTYEEIARLAIPDLRDPFAAKMLTAELNRAYKNE